MDMQDTRERHEGQAVSADAAGEKLYSYFPQFGHGHYAGALVGLIAAYAPEPARVSIKRLSKTYGCPPDTLETALKGLVRNGHVARVARGSYAITDAGYTEMEEEKAIRFRPSLLKISGMTPRLAAVVSLNVDDAASAAGMMCVERTKWYALRARARRIIETRYRVTETRYRVTRNPLQGDKKPVTGLHSSSTKGSLRSIEKVSARTHAKDNGHTDQPVSTLDGIRSLKLALQNGVQS